MNSFLRNRLGAMTIYIAPLVMLIGLVLYLLPLSAKGLEIARILFFCGAFVTLMQVAGHLVLRMAPS